MKCQELLSEPLSELHSRTAESCEMEEQRRQVERAYKFQMGGCAKPGCTDTSAIHYSAANPIEQIGTCTDISAIHYSAANPIEQIGTPKATKMKCQDMLSEALSELHSRPADSRRQEEQRRQVERAHTYKFQMGECAKHIRTDSSVIHCSAAILIEQIGTPKAT
jgi:ribosomal protein L34E